MSIRPNAIVQADCLDLLERIDKESISLVYLDPPIYVPTSNASKMDFETDNEGYRRYFTFLAQVLQQSRRVLTRTGNLFFHADPSITGSVRLILDQIFGKENYRTEFIWPYRRLSVAESFRANHDVIYWYSKTGMYASNRVYRSLTNQEIRTRYPNSDHRGPFMLVDLTSPTSRPSQQFEWKGVIPSRKRSWRYDRQTLDQLDQDGQIYRRDESDFPKLKVYLNEASEVEVGSIWDDIPVLTANARESVGYPTQKPVALLRRVIEIGSNSGDTVLDPFCGAGTTMIAGQALNRKWIGCDLLPEACVTAAKRLTESFDLPPDNDFLIINQDTLKTEPTQYDMYVPVITGFEDFTRLLPTRYVLGKPVSVEEIRHYEFKEVKGVHPAESIENTADEYAVAFLNSEGGCVLWGVRNEDRVTLGVRLAYPERDRLRRLVTEKLNSINPRIDPTHYRIELHQVIDDAGKPVEDTWIVELVVPRPLSPGPYFTGSNELWVKTDAGKKKLEGPALADWIMRRQRVI